MVECMFLCDTKPNQPLFEMHVTSGNNQSIFANIRGNFVHLFTIVNAACIGGFFILFIVYDLECYHPQIIFITTFHQTQY